MDVLGLFETLETEQPAAPAIALDADGDPVAPCPACNWPIYWRDVARQWWCQRCYPAPEPLQPGMALMCVPGGDRPEDEAACR